MLMKIEDECIENCIDCIAIYFLIRNGLYTFLEHPSCLYTYISKHIQGIMISVSEFKNICKNIYMYIMQSVIIAMFHIEEIYYFSLNKSAKVYILIDMFFLNVRIFCFVAVFFKQTSFSICPYFVFNTVIAYILNSVRLFYRG